MTIRTIPLAAGLCCVTALAAVPALAADVRGQLTPELIYEHCRAAGVGSETEGTFMLPGGQRLAGTVLCTAEDLVAPKLTATRGHGDDAEDDDHRGGHDDEDDDD